MRELRFLFFVLVLIASKTSLATIYYADPSSTSSTVDGSLTNPFKSLADVQNHLWFVSPGDTILFKRGQTFVGNLVLLSGGTQTNPILLSTYGSGPKPIFIYDLANGNSAIDRWTIKLDGADYVSVENLAFDDPTMDSTVHNVDANVGVAIFITQSNNCIVRNVTVKNLGEGVIIGGNHCLVENSNMSHLRMIQNTQDSAGYYGDDDFGAASVVITGSHNQILNNHFEDNWGHSYDYGFDGGGIEIFGSNSDSNKIMYNTVIECNGFSEIGGAQTAWDNIYAYNLVINCTVIGAFHLSGNFGSDIQRMKMYNNVFVETKKHLTEPSRILGIGALSASSAPDILTLKNNIFYLGIDVDMAHSTTIGNTYGTRVIHENNIYIMNGGSLNYPLDSSELLFNSPIDLFTDTTDTNPALWDYKPKCMSYAIDFGQDLSFLTDFNGTAITNLPEAGIIENSCLDTTGLNVILEKTEDEVMIVYPNPTDSELNYSFELTSSDLVKINLFNVNGALVFTTVKWLSQGVNNGSIKVDNLTPGVYLLKVDGKRINTRKRVIIK